MKKQNNKIQKNMPFYQAYHDNAYILRHDCSKNLSLREHREPRVYKFINKSKKEVVVYKIDGGLINNNDVLKCDYGIYTEDDILFLIELKGSDLEHAIEQINSTIQILLKKPHIILKKLNARIVLSKVRTPNLLSIKEKSLKRLLWQSYGGGDLKRQSQVIEDIY